MYKNLLAISLNLLAIWLITESAPGMEAQRPLKKRKGADEQAKGLINKTSSELHAHLNSQPNLSEEERAQLERLAESLAGTLGAEENHRLEFERESLARSLRDDCASIFLRRDLVGMKLFLEYLVEQLDFFQGLQIESNARAEALVKLLFWAHFHGDDAPFVELILESEALRRLSTFEDSEKGEEFGRIQIGISFDLLRHFSDKKPEAALRVLDSLSHIRFRQAESSSPSGKFPFLLNQLRAGNTMHVLLRPFFTNINQSTAISSAFTTSYQALVTRYQQLQKKRANAPSDTLVF